MLLGSTTKQNTTQVWGVLSALLESTHWPQVGKDGMEENMELSIISFFADKGSQQQGIFPPE